LQMTIEELESACDASLTLDFSRHPIEGPELSLWGLFYPLGFPTALRTNCPSILEFFREAWGVFERQFDTPPIRVDVHVVENASAECPPAPTHRLMRPLLVGVADLDNYSVADLQRNRTHITVSRAAVAHELYLRHFFLEASPLVHVATRFTTPIHAGCVSLNGCGVLLCGDSGAGKSTLSYACARAGWTYVTDDSTYLVHGADPHHVTGNCHLVRLRPPAAELFPELQGKPITPRVEGKPSLEIPTDSLPLSSRSQTARVNYFVFLNRRAGGTPALVPYSKDVARQYMRQVPYGSPDTLAVQYEAIERLLSLDVFELRYTDLDWAVDRLQQLAEVGW